MAASQVPVAYQCFPIDGQPVTFRVCELVFEAVKSNERMELTTDLDVPYFQIILLPVSANDYVSVAVATALVDPALDGLAFSSYYGVHLMQPGRFGNSIAASIVDQLISGMQSWYEMNEDRLMRVHPQLGDQSGKHRYECSYG
jgi:hypothetical protein